MFAKIKPIIFIRYAIKAVLILIISVSLTNPVYAAVKTEVAQAKEAKQEQKVKTGESVISSVTKEIEGEVSGITKLNISVIYSRNVEHGSAEEMLLPLDEKVKVVRKKNLKDIKPGDTVRVQYREETIEKEGKTEARRKAEVVTFLRPAPVKPETPEVDEEAVLATEER